MSSIVEFGQIYASNFASDVVGNLKRLENLLKLGSSSLKTTVDLFEVTALAPTKKYVSGLKESFSFTSAVCKGSDTIKNTQTAVKTKSISLELLQNASLFVGKTMQSIDIVINNGLTSARTLVQVQGNAHWKTVEGAFLFAGVSLSGIIKGNDYIRTETRRDDGTLKSTFANRKCILLTSTIFSFAYTAGKLSLIAISNFNLFPHTIFAHPGFHVLSNVTNLVGVAKDGWDVYVSKKNAQQLAAEKKSSGAAN